VNDSEDPISGALREMARHATTPPIPADALWRAGRRRRRVAITAPAASLAAAAVLVSVVVLGAHAHKASGPTMPAATARTHHLPPGHASYLLASGLKVMFLQWQPLPGDKISGTLTVDAPVGTAPAEHISTRRWPFTGTLAGGHVTLTIASATMHGTIRNGTLTIQLAPYHGIRPHATLTPAALAQYNAAVANLRQQIADDNTAARKAQQERAHASAAAKPTR
jgi:hypothetical protein